MSEFLIEGRMNIIAPFTISYHIEAKDSFTACLIYLIRHPNAKILSINNKDFIGACIDCGEPILEGDDYQYSGRIYRCPKHRKDR